MIMNKTRDKGVSKISDVSTASVWHLTFLSLLTATAYLCMCSYAFALSGFTPVGIVLCNVVTMIWSDIGRGLATLAVMIIGVGATLGKVTWGQAILLATGISLVFGAPFIVPQLFLLGFGNFGAGLIFSCV